MHYQRTSGPRLLVVPPPPPDLSAVSFERAERLAQRRGSDREVLGKSRCVG
jgi:hypothetical protein